jgi:hypothetical protein
MVEAENGHLLGQVGQARMAGKAGKQARDDKWGRTGMSCESKKETWRLGCRLERVTNRVEWKRRWGSTGVMRLVNWPVQQRSNFVAAFWLMAKFNVECWGWAGLGWAGLGRLAQWFFMRSESACGPNRVGFSAGSSSASMMQEPHQELAEIVVLSASDSDAQDSSS